MDNSNIFIYQLKQSYVVSSTENIHSLPQSCLCFTVTHRSHSWCDGMGCHSLQYKVTHSIDPWHPDSPAVYPGHPAAAPRSHFSIRQFGLTRQGCHKTASALLLPFIGLPDPQICLQFSISGIICTANCASHEFERTRGKVTANMERNVSSHHTELVCLNARSYRIVHSR
ncbi:uncharacterized protein TNCV_4213221 [Trichonephila clavipes]|nr:uncharacterized protein TNCV_4213221 [Trichonephila clavipes]